MRGRILVLAVVMAWCGALLPPTATAQVPKAGVPKAGVLKVTVGETVVVKAGFGRLDINVSPERARVYVDRRLLGTGDQSVVKSAGSHRVKVVLGDGRSLSESVRVDSGRVTRVSISLK
jgi:hypothetical protein